MILEIYKSLTYTWKLHGTEAAQFHEKEYINGIFSAVGVTRNLKKSTEDYLMTLSLFTALHGPRLQLGAQDRSVKYEIMASVAFYCRTKRYKRLNTRIRFQVEVYWTCTVKCFIIYVYCMQSVIYLYCAFITYCKHSVKFLIQRKSIISIPNKIT